MNPNPRWRRTEQDQPAQPAFAPRCPATRTVAPYSPSPKRSTAATARSAAAVASSAFHNAHQPEGDLNERDQFTRVSTVRGARSDRIQTTSRPPVNAVNQAMYREIEELFPDLDRFLPGAKINVLTRAGKHFCAGNDLEEFATVTSENTGRSQTRRDAPQASGPASVRCP